MFDVTISINGVNIHKIYGHNQGEVDIFKEPDICKYYYELYEIGKGNLKTGNTTHAQSDGMLKLAIKLLRMAEKERVKNIKKLP